MKSMVFIDGSWLYHGREVVRRKIGDPKLAINYEKLPRILIQKLGAQLGAAEVDLVRTNFFASTPVNVDPRDISEVEDQWDFYDMLHEDFHYETEIYEIDFQGRRLHLRDRDQEDPFIPEEKCVDIALASSALYYAAIPFAYDAAIMAIGDEDYMPVLQHIRRLGKRVMIASIHGMCANIYDQTKDPTDSKRVRDCDTVFIDDLIGEIVLEYTPRMVECQSPTHKGDRKVWTRFQPRKGRPFYCDQCRETYRRERSEAEQALGEEYPRDKLIELAEGFTAGRITKIFPSKGFGFIRSKDGEAFYFHATAVNGAEFSDLSELEYVQFRPGIGAASGYKTRAVEELRPL